MAAPACSAGKQLRSQLETFSPYNFQTADSRERVAVCTAMHVEDGTEVDVIASAEPKASIDCSRGRHGNGQIAG